MDLCDLDMNRKITCFFKPATSIDEIIPPEWKKAPVTPKSVKRPVGRPRSSKKYNVDDVIVMDSDSDYENEMIKEDGVLLRKVPEKRGKYKSYTMSEKQELVELASLYGNNCIAAKFNVPKTTLSTWKSTLDASTPRTKSGRKKGSGRRLSYSQDTDTQILTWILKQRDSQLPVSRTAIREYAQKVICKENPDFKASVGWVNKFMIRHELTVRAKTSLSQKLPGDLEFRLKVFYDHLRELALDLELDNDDLIINMDEVPMVFELVPGKTVAPIGSKDVRVLTTGGEKRHCTLVLAVTAAGKYLPGMIIFKGKRDLKLTLPQGWIVCVNEKAWMNSEVMQRWVKEILRKFTERRPSLLVMDSFAAHLTEDVTKELKLANVTPAIIPGGCTSKAQPLDVVLNKPMKDHLRTQWSSFIAEQYKDVVRTDQVKPATKQNVLDWVHASVCKMEGKPDVIKKAFRVTGIKAALNGTRDSDNMLHNQKILDDILNDEDSGEDDFEGFSECELDGYDSDPFTGCD